MELLPWGGHDLLVPAISPAQPWPPKLDRRMRGTKVRRPRPRRRAGADTAPAQPAGSWASKFAVLLPLLSHQRTYKVCSCSSRLSAAAWGRPSRTGPCGAAGEQAQSSDRSSTAAWACSTQQAHGGAAPTMREGVWKCYPALTS